jgi:peroxiredoxin Q/BCP
MQGFEMEQAAAPTVKPRVPRGPLFFCLTLMLVGLGFIGIAVRHYLVPPEPDLPAKARALLLRQNQQPLSEPLAKILAEAENNHFPSYEHPLVGKPAPDFTRPDVDGQPWSLKQALVKGPVVVVFYYGYYCDHCVSQLFGLKQDYQHFRELGAEVVALSADSSATTREKYKQFEAFPFPVLWDDGNRVAEAYGVFKPAHDTVGEELLHGTFVIGQDGIVTWAAFATTPFGRNDTLLHEIARLTGRAGK